MSVREKIEETERWLVKIKNAYPYDHLEIRDNINAFLNTVTSIPDHLLEEYQVKFGFNISLDVRNIRVEFRNKVESSTNQNVINFFQWFNQKKTSIETDKVGNNLINTRHRNIHRATQAPNGSIMFDEIQRAADYTFINEYFAEAMKIKKKPEHVTVPEEVNNIQIMWYFDGLPEMDVIRACEQLFNLMKDMVSDAHRLFP